jgi:hypothetical protein
MLATDGMLAIEIAGTLSARAGRRPSALPMRCVGPSSGAWVPFAKRGWLPGRSARAGELSERG